MGCGKTYRIENELKNAMNGKAIVLRISLFSISTSAEIHNAVKKAWIEAYYKEKGAKGITDKIHLGRKFVSKLEFLPEWTRGIASTDIGVFISIKNILNGKKAILVFDDLERCQMHMTDVLGIINEYCENQKFHTIIIANEERIRKEETSVEINVDMNKTSTQGERTEPNNKQLFLSVKGLSRTDNTGISFVEMKEKVIQRTLHYIPNYEAIVHTVIMEMKCFDYDYQTYIKSREPELLDLFAPDRNSIRVSRENSNENSTRPHNIRILKCAIIDFHRVYSILKANDYSDVNGWLYSFVSYVIAYKADIAKSYPTEAFFADNNVSVLFPAFQEKYMPQGLKNWILHGIWDRQSILQEIETIKEREKADTPVDILRSNRIHDVDEKTLYDGFEDLLQLAYQGCLSLDEYVLFIQNAYWARNIGDIYPVSTDWKKLMSGISMQIGKVKAELPEGQILHSYIDEAQKSITRMMNGMHTLLFRIL